MFEEIKTFAKRLVVPMTLTFWVKTVLAETARLEFMYTLAFVFR